jgi:putative oxidoreductase
LFGAWGWKAVELTGLLGLAGVLEFFGGLLILFGLFTRPVAFVLAGQMAVAYWMAHFPKARMPIENGGELAALYCFVFLFLFANGGGSFSLDGWLRGRKS